MSSEYCICPPKLRSLASNGPTRVKHSSPVSHRKAVESIARYFGKELGYYKNMFHAASKPSDREFVPYEAYLFHDEAYNLKWENKKTEVVCLGACCFYKHYEGWSLHWVWFHPYFRKQGFLSRAWPEFRQRYGEFRLEEPLSLAMEQFVAKHSMA